MSEENKAPEGGERPGWVDEDPFADRAAQASGAPPASTPPGTRAARDPADEVAPRATPRQRPQAKDPADEVRAGPEPAVQELRRPATPQRRRHRLTAETARIGGRRVLGLPIWGWIVLALVGVAVLLIVFDARNRDRFRLICRAGHLELQQGRRLMWPFGFETVGGRFKPVALPPNPDCSNQIFNDRGESEAAFLDFLLTEVQRVRSGNPDAKQLEQLRALVLQALRITRGSAHRPRREEAEHALADVAYRQGRAGLARVEDELRGALSHLREAQKRAGDRYEDLDDWIEHLETLLRTVAPAPGTTKAPGPSALPPIAPSPRPPTSLPTAPGDADAGPPTPRVDAGDGPDTGPEAPPASRGGILM